MATIAAVRGAVPPHRYRQSDITDAFARVLGAEDRREELLRTFHANAGVEFRHLALTLEEYPELADFGAANDAFIRVSTELGEEAVSKALAAAGLHPSDVDLLMTTSVTGIAAPSLDARLVPRLGLRTDVKRVPLFGLGCVAGAAGIARVHDYLEGHPDEVAVLLAVELCSLTVQRDDTSMPNLVASGLFGDGAAAVVMVGARRAKELGLRGPSVVATRSRFYPETERTMGWDIGATGFRIVLANDVADVVEQFLGDDVRTFLSDHDLSTDDVAAWVCHPGGPKVLRAIQSALDLPDGELDITWDLLASHGNLSSVSVLHVLEATMRDKQLTPGSAGTLLSMGPGFCAELVLLEW